MKGQFQMESGSAMQGSGKTIPGFEQNPEQQAWLSGNAAPPLHPREDLQLDPLFLEDSWTLGVPAAIKNWEQRRLGRTLRAGQNRQPWEFESRGTTFFLQERAWYAEHFSAAQEAAVARPNGSGIAEQTGNECPALPWEESAAQTECRARRGERQAQPKWEGSAVESEIRPETTYSMTPRRACRLLGVTASSTGEQIKAAYRRMASQWHPDRLERGSEHARRMATDQMAAINEAYSLLRSGPRQQAA